MKDILDFDEENNKVDKKQSDRTFNYFLLSLISFLILLSGSFFRIGTFLPSVISYLYFAVSGIATIVFSIKGSILGIKEVKNKKGYSYKYFIGLIGNTCIILLFIFSLAFIYMNYRTFK